MMITVFGQGLRALEQEYKAAVGPTKQEDTAEQTIAHSL